MNGTFACQRRSFFGLNVVDRFYAALRLLNDFLIDVCIRTEKKALFFPYQDVNVLNVTHLIAHRYFEIDVHHRPHYLKNELTNMQRRKYVMEGLFFSCFIHAT